MSTVTAILQGAVDGRGKRSVFTSVPLLLDLTESSEMAEPAARKPGAAPRPHRLPA